MLYDWRAGVALCQANAHMSDVHTCRFNPFSPGTEFVSTGNKHVKVSGCSGCVCVSVIR